MSDGRAAAAVWPYPHRTVAEVDRVTERNRELIRSFHERRRQERGE